MLNNSNTHKQENNTHNKKDKQVNTHTSKTTPPPQTTHVNINKCKKQPHANTHNKQNNTQTTHTSKGKATHSQNNNIANI